VRATVELATSKAWATVEVSARWCRASINMLMPPSINIFIYSLCLLITRARSLGSCGQRALRSCTSGRGPLRQMTHVQPKGNSR